MSDSVDYDKRDFLKKVSALVGVAAVSPAIAMLLPSRNDEEVKTVDISEVYPGEAIAVVWGGKPVSILHRTDDQIYDVLNDVHHAKMVDETLHDSINPKTRSIKDEFFVSTFVCTHLGCVPLYKEKPWYDDYGDCFFCPCHGGFFDLAGRVFKGPPPEHLAIPPHFFVDESTILIGRWG